MRAPTKRLPSNAVRTGAFNSARFKGCERTEFNVLIGELPERERSRFCQDRKIFAEEIADAIHAIDAV
jgi:hypothetical protein